MSSEDRRSPGLLERLRVQPTTTAIPKRSSSISKRQIQLAAEDQGTSSFKRRKTDIVDSVVEALSADQVLHSLLWSVIMVKQRSGLWLSPQIKSITMNLQDTCHV